MLPTNINLDLLNGSNGFCVKMSNSIFSGASFSAGLGDIDGDGLNDFGIGSSNGIFVIYGSPIGFTNPLDLSHLNSSQGFFINSTITSFGSAGDVNGDGKQDIIFGNSNVLNQAGAAYVLYGSSIRMLPIININYINGNTGFTIYDTFDNELAGTAVAGVGDIDGNGYDDVIVGAPGAKNNGKVYVIYGGQNLPSETDVMNLNGTNGFTIYTDQTSRVKNFGILVSMAGDFNLDGLTDMLVASQYLSFLIYGSKNFSDIFNISYINGTNGFTITDTPISTVATSLAGGRDINNDGKPDILIGNGQQGPYNQGTAYVIFGAQGFSASSINVTTLNGKNGFNITDNSQGNNIGVSVALTPDVNGDKIPDIIVGANLYGNNAGETSLIYGSDSFPISVDPFYLDGLDGVVMFGSSNSGTSVSGIGDVNGDYLGDMLIIVRNNWNTGNLAYVVYGEYFIPPYETEI